MKKIALVLEGGALRGIFSSGVLDVFTKEGLEFPYIVSVSAGTGNALSFISKQPERAKNCMLASGQDSFYGSGQMLKNKKMMNLEKLFDEFPFKQFPFNFDAYFSSGIKHEIVVSDCKEGKPKYMTATESPERLCLVSKASCSMPVFCSEVIIDGRAYLDGGLTDPIPLQRAFDMGYEKAVVVLTRQDRVYPNATAGMTFLHHMLYKDMPRVIEAYENRHELYKSEIELVHKAEDEGKAFVIRPTERAVSHFETDRVRLEAFYEHGCNLAQAAISGIKAFME